jgi:hypothetical protein
MIFIGERTAGKTQGADIGRTEQADGLGGVEGAVPYYRIDAEDSVIDRADQLRGVDGEVDGGGVAGEHEAEQEQPAGWYCATEVHR